MCIRDRASTFRQVGIATGIAGLGAVFVHQIKPAVVSSLQATPSGQAVLSHGGSRLGQALASGGVREAAAAIPVASARNALLTAYRSGFVTTFNHLMTIATVVAFVGAVGCLFLVRQKDFVPSVGSGEWTKPGDGDGDGDGNGDGDDSAWSASGS